MTSVLSLEEVLCSHLACEELLKVFGGLGQHLWVLFIHLVSPSKNHDQGIKSNHSTTELKSITILPFLAPSSV